MLITYARNLARVNLVKLYIVFLTIVCVTFVYYFTLGGHSDHVIYQEKFVADEKPVEIVAVETGVKTSGGGDAYLKLKSKCECRKEEEISVEKVAEKFRITRGGRDFYEIDSREIRLESITCDLYNVFRRGLKTKVLGVSLYGTDDRYYKSLKIIAKQMAKFYPDWVMRIHYDNSITNSVICEIECLVDESSGKLFNNMDFCHINEIPKGLFNNTWSSDYTHAMKWRWLPMGDPFVDVFLSRDTDSWIHEREAEAVKMWLKSDNLFHVMRDHPFHTVPMLGGMWGYQNFRDRKLADTIIGLVKDRNIARGYNGNGKSPKGQDQDFLGAHVWQHAQKNSMTHASFLCHSYGGSNIQAFTVQRPNNNCYATCSFCCDPVYNETWTFECPEECRPKDHPDWKFC